MHKPYVVIETHEDYLEKFRDTHCDLLYIIGDATDETVLDQTSVGARQRADCGLTADR